jgi:flagellin
MVINTNISAETAAANLQSSQAMLSKSLARLSSGSKITDPSDDAAGMAVSTRLDSQVNRINAAKSNVGNAISFTQTQDGFLQKVGKALDRMSELAISAQDVTKTDADRSLYNKEFQTLSAYIDNIATKDFNGISLFSTTTMNVTTDGDGGTFAMAGFDLTGIAYSNATSADISTIGAAGTGAVGALTFVKAAITQLSTDRATIGAYQARLTYTSDQLEISSENLTSASSRIKDVDVAEESTRYAKANVLVQSGTAMLAQANQQPQTVLKLLQ